MKRKLTPLFLFALIVQSLTGQVFTKITTGPVVTEENNSYYATWGDYDKDGDLDLFHSLFFAAANNPNGNNLMFLNTCDGNFSQIKNIPGQLVNDGLTGAYSYWIDYDNDGDLDLFAGPKYLYENQGDGSFMKVNKQITTPNIPPYPLYVEIGTAAWADYDNDGFLDLYFGKQEIHRSNQNKDFIQLNIPPFSNSNPNAAASSVSWGDYNNDGLMDIFVTCPGDNTGQASPNYLYKNLGNGSFSSITTNTSMINTRSYGAVWADYDNDLDLDLFIADAFGSHDKLFTNNGNGTFTEVLTGPVVANQSGNQAGGAWADYDNDGDLDLYVTNFTQNILYDNNGNGTFTKNTTEIVVNDNPVESYGAAWADYDNDGDLDLFVPTAFGDPNDNLYKNNVYQNNSSNKNWLKMHCSGVYSNKDAIGTRVYVKATINGVSKWQMREINANSTRGGESGGASGHVVHIGLGNASIIDSLKIVWPKSGITQIFTNVNPNQFLEIVENINSLANVTPCIADLPISNPAILSGKAFIDVNNNCVFETGTDYPIANKEIKAVPGPYFGFSDNDGNYQIKVPAGTYTISQIIQNDSLVLNSCQTNSAYVVTASSGNTAANNNFANAQRPIPCNGFYGIAINPVGIDPGNCPSGQILTTPCPGYAYRYCFNITNNSTLPTNANSVLTINFPTGFQITAVNSSCANYPFLLPTNANPININVSSIPIGGNCNVCVDVNVPSSAVAPFVITADFNNTGVANPNLVFNGDFQLGNTGFTSGYASNCTAWPGNYCVGTTPAIMNGGWVGTGNFAPTFLFADGAMAPNVPVWISQPIPISPNTTYVYSAWYRNIVSPNLTGLTNPNMEVTINGSPLPVPASITGPLFSNPNVWVNNTFTWCSNLLNTIQLRIRSSASAFSGNDFGIDDISLTEARTRISRLSQPIACSCDPNDKVVTPLGCGVNGNVSKNQKLTYKIRFQNTGSGPAYNVLLSDKLNSNLDLSTLEIISASHSITSAQIFPNNNLIIKFDNINLPSSSFSYSASSGFVILSISPKQGLPDGTVITNQTGIYFDENSVVLTDVTKNTLYDQPTPDMAFTYKHSCNQTGLVYDFNYTGSTPDNATYLWEFNGATPFNSTLQNPLNITFANDIGYKLVKLTLTRNGCTEIISDTIKVNSGLSDNGKKVTICHNGSLMTVGLNALSAHLAHGDCIGSCSPSGGARMMSNIAYQNVIDVFEMDLTPNPTSDLCTISLKGITKSNKVLKIEVYSSTGQFINELIKGNPVTDETEIRFDTKIYANGLYFIKTTYGDQAVLKKLIITH